MLQLVNVLPIYDTLEDTYNELMVLPPPPYTATANPDNELVIEFGPLRNHSYNERDESQQIRRRYLQQLSPPLIQDFIAPNFRSNKYILHFKRNNHLQYCLISLNDNEQPLLRIKYSHLSISLEHITSHRILGEIMINHAPNNKTNIQSNDIILNFPSHPNDIKSKAQLTSYQEQYIITLEEELQFVKYRWKKYDDIFKLHMKSPLKPTNNNSQPLNRNNSTKYDKLIANLKFNNDHQATLSFPFLQSNINSLYFLISAAYLFRFNKDESSNIIN